ncbi:MAG: hypothetical protein H0W40_18790 [Methylibium sp.]|uniref:hypothetical protein n=1 Tax=Methylibium sp. TaxID=2067992 RepID=UPI0018344C20|nr:hypothetical protein [Methylibium sp.]MBA3599396.1 hypothetical protein [Methylibium sp.]
MGAAGSGAIKADAKTAAIATALRERQLLAFVYDGQPRAVEPHIYGLSGSGRPALSAYQVAGGSASGEPLGWKLFHVSEMRQVKLLAAHFAGPRPDYNARDKAFRSVEIAL